MDARAGYDEKTPRPSWLRRRLAKWAVVAYRLGIGALLTRRVMILTTRGRVTGRPRKTPLWYARDGDVIYCMSGWGSSSDWWKNLVAYPHASLRLGRVAWKAQGELIHDATARERVLYMIQDKYGRRTTRLFYHVDLINLVAFPVGGAGELPS